MFKYDSETDKCQLATSFDSSLIISDDGIDVYLENPVDGMYLWLADTILIYVSIQRLLVIGFLGEHVIVK